MTQKKVGIFFIVTGILAILSFLIYPHLSEKTETAVPVLRYFSDSGVSENSRNGIAADDDSEIWENADGKSVTGISQTTETVSCAVFPIDINAAAAEEFMQIKGIGRATADNIILYRKDHGYFYSVEDLLNVDGIGEKKLENIRDYICVNEAALPETVAAAGNDDTNDDRIIEELTDFERASEEETTSEEYRPNFPIELNTASAKDLTYIKGIGDTIAGRIVEYAQSCGFYDVNDLLNVSGIGKSKLDDILPYVYVDTSGLPQKNETAASDLYNNILKISDMFQNGITEPAVPEIYMSVFICV